MQYSLPGENKDGGISLGHLPTEIETKIIYSLPGEDKDVGIYVLENLPEEIETETKNAIFSTWRGQRWRQCCRRARECRPR
jgi:hypothetical protein